MKNIAGCALAGLMLILCGCEYNPYYDGQPLSLYHADCGLLTEDGGHLYIPLEGEKRYTLEFYGGKGKNHTVEVADPDMLGVSYIKTDIRDIPFDDSEITPAGVVLHPYMKGDTSVTVTDEDTGESVQLNVHICDACHAIEVYKGNYVFDTGTVLVFRYGGVDDVLKICRKDSSDGKIRQVADGRYRFKVYDNKLCMEVTSKADASSEGLSSGGSEGTELYEIEYISGFAESVEDTMRYMNLEDYPIFTRAAEEYHEYNGRFQFVRITDKPSGNERFYTYSSVIIPWIAD